MKMLEKDPARRFQTSKESEEALLSCLADVDSKEAELAKEMLDDPPLSPICDTPNVFGLVGAEKEQVTIQLQSTKVEDMDTSTKISTTG
jgi:hypothetical protein